MLFNKLNKAGIRGKALDLFRNYLTRRTQRVGINDTFSNSTKINMGVVHGSVLGPLLFVIYINDLFDLKLRGSLQLYADDCALTYKNTSITNVL